MKFASDEYKRLKAEVSRKASMANKRLVRLENNNLTELSAYQQWVSYDGGVKFGVRGKDYNQLQQELARVNQFINNKTSLVREANRMLKGMAEDLGMNYVSVKELPDMTRNFFELASKVEQHLQNTQQSAFAIGYQKIWEVINEYVETEKVDLTDSEFDVESVIDEITKLLDYELVEQGYEGYFTGDTLQEWFKV